MTLKIEEHLPYINKFCYDNSRYVYLYDTMDDFVQEMCLVAQKVSPTYNSKKGQPTTFLTRCFKNAIRNKIRDNNREKRSGATLISYEGKMEGGKWDVASDYNTETESFISWAKEKLPAMVWDKVMGDTVAEICRKYNIKRYQFQNIYKECLENMRKKLQKSV